MALQCCERSVSKFFNSTLLPHDQTFNISNSNAGPLRPLYAHAAAILRYYLALESNLMYDVINVQYATNTAAYTRYHDLITEWLSREKCHLQQVYGFHAAFGFQRILERGFSNWDMSWQRFEALTNVSAAHTE